MGVRIVYFSTLNIQGIEIEGISVLAPMAGVADNAFRLMAREGGASLVCTELISADGLVRKNEKTMRLMNFLPEERPIGIQLFGKDPFVLAEAARVAEEVKPDFIDLNFGCPAKRVVRGGSGAALLKDLPRMKAIARAVVDATSMPVSAKIRSGWDADSIVAVEAAKILEDAGVCWITVHARTKTMGFRCHADWQVIQDVKASVSIPVIGNGDVAAPEDAKQMREESGCDLVMIGRGALGRPWLFHHVDRYLKTGDLLKAPCVKDRIDVCLRHYDLALGLLGKDRGVKEMRKHIGWYLKGMHGSAKVRQAVFLMDNPEDVKMTLKAYAATAVIVK